MAPVGDVPECEDASDCWLGGGCCDCFSEVHGRRGNPDCAIICDHPPQCEVLNARATCIHGRCALEYSCDMNLATCDAIPAQCPFGQTRTVIDGCYGPCIDLIDCADVTDCSVCGTDQACVTYDELVGPKHRCVDVLPDCNGTPSCACMGESICPGPFAACSDLEGRMYCNCPTCS